MPAFLTSPAFLQLSLVVAMLGLALAILADHLQLLAKYRGALQKRVAGGYNLAMKVMVINRLGAVFYFLFVAFSVDNGIEVNKLALAYASVLIALALPTIWILFRLQVFQNRSGPGVLVLDYKLWPPKIVIAAFVATSFNLLGLTLPWLAGAANPDLRLTLANTSFLFNTLYTVVNVFYIEHRFAVLIDAEQSEIHGFVTGVMIARLCAFLAVGAGLAILT